MPTNKLFALAAAAALATVPIMTAQADVAIGIDTGSGITTVASSSGTTASYSGSQGTFSFNLIGVGGPTPNPLDSTAFDVSSSGGSHELKVWVSANDASPKQAGLLKSALTSNLLPSGWSATISTYASASNKLFDTATPLASYVFSSIKTFDLITPFVPSGPWSVTTLYDITSFSKDTALLTAAVRSFPVPEPGSLALLGATLLGFAGLRRYGRSLI